MYGFCNNNALYSARLSFTMFVFLNSFRYQRLLLFRIKSHPTIKVFLTKTACNVLLKSSKHEEVTFLHEFIFVFILYFIGSILSKNVKNGGKRDQRKDNKGEMSVEGGLKPSAYYELICSLLFWCFF